MRGDTRFRQLLLHPEKRHSLSFPPVFSFFPFLSSPPPAPPPSFSFQLPSFLFPRVLRPLRRDSERKAMGALRRTPTVLGVCLGRPWPEPLWTPWVSGSSYVSLRDCGRKRSSSPLSAGPGSGSFAACSGLRRRLAWESALPLRPSLSGTLPWAGEPGVRKSLWFSGGSWVPGRTQSPVEGCG